MKLQAGVSLVSAALETNTLCFTVGSFRFLPPFLYLPRFPSFCHASFSLCFTAEPQGRGACLHTLSPEGSGISESKHVAAKSTIWEETMGCLLAYGGVSWGFGPACCDHTSAPFTTVPLLSRVQTQSGDRCFRGARYCRFLFSRVKQPQTVQGTKKKWKAPLCCFACSHVKSSPGYVK